MDLPPPTLPNPESLPSTSEPPPPALPETLPPVLSPAAPLMLSCACCGQLALPEMMVQLGDAWVMAAHKDRWVEALRQGENPRQKHNPLDLLELKFGRLLVATWYLTRQNLLPFLVLHTVFWLPLTLLEGWLDMKLPGRDELHEMMVSTRRHNSLDGLIGAIPTAATLFLCSATFRGRRLSGWSAVNEALKVWPRMFGANLLRSFGLVLGIILLLVPGAIFYTRTAFIHCSIVEGCSVPVSFEESMKLTKGHFWRVAGYYTLLTLMLLVPLIFAGVSEAMIIPEEGWPWQASSLVEFVFSIPMLLLTPFTFVFYQALRDRP